MILAAGRGERMRPLTEKLPKPLLEVGGHRLIEYHLASLVDLGVRDVVVNLSWHGDRIREALGDGAARGLSIRYSDEGPEPLGTGGGIAAALSLLGAEPFIVLNGDVWTDFPLRSLKRPAGSLAHLVLVDNPEHHPGGDYALEAGGRVGDGAEKLTFSGVSIIDPALFTGVLPGFLALKPLLDAALGAGRLSGQRHGGAWRDVGTPARLAALDAELRLGKARHSVLSSPVG
jgi:MurNAc alpha-1-phosphate uridylyltransferase